MLRYARRPCVQPFSARLTCMPYITPYMYVGTHTLMQSGWCSLRCAVCVYVRACAGVGVGVDVVVGVYGHADTRGDASGAGTQRAPPASLRAAAGCPGRRPGGCSPASFLLLLRASFLLLLGVCAGVAQTKHCQGLSSCVALPGALFLCLRLSASVCACFPCFWHLLVHMLSHLLVHMRASHAHACTRRTWRMLRGLDGLLSNGVLSNALLS